MGRRSSSGAPIVKAFMADKAGVWIDHRRAVVVALSEGGERLSEILSHVEKHAERGGDRPMQGSYESHQVPADDSRQRALTGELNGYYDAVIAAIHGFSPVLLLGPGEAKGELHKRLVKKKLGDAVADVQTTDKLTNPQIIAKVRAYFSDSAPRTH